MVEREKSLLNAQVALIGSVLLDPHVQGEVFASCAADDFTSPTYRHVFQSCRNVFFSGRPLDEVTAAAAAGEEYVQTIAEIIAATPTSANWRAYADILCEQAALYRLRDLGVQLSGATALDEAQELLAKANASVVSRAELRGVTMAEALADFIERQKEKKKAEYLSWGFAALDATLYCERGDFVILGGRPSSGKTLLALDFARHIAQKHRVAFFSLETGEKKLTDRMVARIFGLSFGKIKRYELSEAELGAVMAQSKKFIELPIDLYSASGLTASDIQSQTLSGRYDVIFIDYLQLIAGGNQSNSQERVAEISRSLHTFAQRHRITVIALCQLSRMEKGSNRAPVLSDLRESGQIEQDADIVMFVYPEYQDRIGSDRKLTVAKNKEGELIRMTLAFDGEHQRMIPRTSRQEVPPDKSVFREETLPDPQIDIWEAQRRRA